MPDLDEDDDPPKPVPPRRRSLIAVVALIVIGLLAIAAGALGVIRELNRPATSAEVRAAGWAELTSR